MELDPFILKSHGLGLAPAGIEDILSLVANMQPECALEMKEVYGVLGHDELVDAIKNASAIASDTYAVFYKGEVMAVLAIQPSGKLWCLFSKRMNELRAAYRMMRAVPALMEFFGGRYIWCDVWTKSVDMVEFMTVTGFLPRSFLQVNGHAMIRFFYCGRDGLQGNEKAHRPVAH